MRQSFLATLPRQRRTLLLRAIRPVDPRDFLPGRINLQHLGGELYVRLQGERLPYLYVSCVAPFPLKAIHISRGDNHTALNNACYYSTTTESPTNHRTNSRSHGIFFCCADAFYNDCSVVSGFALVFKEQQRSMLFIVRIYFYATA